MRLWGKLNSAQIISGKKGHKNYTPGTTHTLYLKNIRGCPVPKLLIISSCLMYLQVLRISSQTGEGIEKAWENMEQFHNIMLENGELEQRRCKQHVIWMWNHIKEQIMGRFKSNPEVRQEIGHFENLVADGDVTPGMAADKLLKIFSHSSSA